MSIILIIILSPAFAQINQISEPQKLECLWQRSAANSQLPQWLLPDQDGERGMAYHNRKLYIVSRSKGTSVRIINAEDGSDAGALPLNETIKGGTYLLNDIEADSSGNLLACNLAATPKSRNFKIYSWKNDSAKPELFISYANPQKFRLGDHFSLTGNISTTADLYAAAAGTDKVLHWKIRKGQPQKNPDILSLSDTPNCGSAPYFAPLANGNFLLNANSLTPRVYDKDTAFISSFSDQVIPTGSTVFKEVINSTDTLLLVYLSTGAAKGGQSVRAVETGNKPADKIVPADIIFNTEPLGVNLNSNFVGDLAVRQEQNILTFYVLATNNGLAAYRYTMPELPPVKPLITAPEVKPQTPVFERPADFKQPLTDPDSLLLPVIFPSELKIENSVSLINSDPIPQPPAYTPPPVKTQSPAAKQISNAEKPLLLPPRNENQTILFTASTAQTVGLLVFNIRGDLLYSYQQYVMPGENSFTIPLKGWKRGIYHYKIILEDRIISGKTLHTR